MHAYWTFEDHYPFLFCYTYIFPFPVSNSQGLVHDQIPFIEILKILGIEEGPKFYQERKKTVFYPLYYLSLKPQVWAPSARPPLPLGPLLFLPTLV